MQEVTLRGSRGKGNPPEPLQYGQDVVRLNGCPDCQGRGWFLINPFATGGTNGAGGIGNMTQCLTCLYSKEYWDEHGKLPPDVEERMKKEPSVK